MTPLVKSEFPKPQVLVRCLSYMPHIRLSLHQLWTCPTFTERE
jgi:hypothetical protein